MRLVVPLLLIFVVLSSFFVAGCQSVDPSQQHFGQGEVYMRKGDFGRAISEFYKVLEEKPKCPEVYHNLAIIADLQKDVENAIRYSEMAIKFYGEKKSAADTGEGTFTEDDMMNTSKIHNLMGTNYIAKKDVVVAIEHFKTAAEYDDSNPIIWENLGQAYLSQENLVKAEDCFKKALEVDPEDARAHIALAFLYEETGVIDDAKEHHSKARQLGEDDPVLISRLNWWEDWKVFENREDPKVHFKYPPKWVASDKKSRVGRALVVFDNTRAVCYGRDSGTLQIVGPDKNYSWFRRPPEETSYQYSKRGLLTFLKKPEFPQYFTEDIQRQEKELANPPKKTETKNNEKDAKMPARAEFWSVDIRDIENYTYDNGSIGATIPVMVKWASGDVFEIRLWFYLGQEESYIIIGTYKLMNDVDSDGNLSIEANDKNNRIKHALDYITSGFEVVPEKED